MAAAVATRPPFITLTMGTAVARRPAALKPLVRRVRRNKRPVETPDKFYANHPCNDPSAFFDVNECTAIATRLLEKYAKTTTPEPETIPLAAAVCTGLVIKMFYDSRYTWDFRALRKFFAPRRCNIARAVEAASNAEMAATELRILAAVDYQVLPWVEYWRKHEEKSAEAM